MADKQKDQSLNRKAFKAGIFYIVSQLFVRGITFLMTPVYTRLLSQAQYNQIKIYESWLLIFAPVMSLCLWRSVERAKYDVKERFNEYVSSVQTLSYISITVFFILFLVFKDPVEKFCSMTDFMLYIAFLYTYAHTSIFYFQRREKQMMRYRASTLFTAATVIPATVLSVALIYMGKRSGHEESLVALRIGGYYIPMIIGGFSAAILMVVQGKKIVSRKYWKYALRFSLPLIPEVLSIQIMNQADKLMVTSMVGAISGSVFALATNVSYIIWILEDSVWNAWLPWMYEKISADESRDIPHYWTVLMHGFGLFSWVLVLFAPEIILVLGGKKYASAVYLIAPMVTGTLFRFYSYSYTAIQNYYKKTGFVAVSTVSVMILNVILNYAGILLFGYRAAAYTTAFSYLVLMCMQAIMEKKLTGEQLIPLPRTLLISCGYFLLCILTMLLFDKPAVFRYAIALCMVPFCLKYFLPQLKLILKTLKSDRKHSKK
ncbi:MAG: oligosaccharide flippase family protein [Candidatus Choladocola sp.]|nr:oligosaccharide flippase family protein [Candidatus Choladocola sp.]